MFAEQGSRAPPPPPPLLEPPPAPRREEGELEDGELPDLTTTQPLPVAGYQDEFRDVKYLDDEPRHESRHRDYTGRRYDGGGRHDDWRGAGRDRRDRDRRDRGGGWDRDHGGHSRHRERDRSRERHRNHRDDAPSHADSYTIRVVLPSFQRADVKDALLKVLQRDFGETTDVRDVQQQARMVTFIDFADVDAAQRAAHAGTIRVGDQDIRIKLAKRCGNWNRRAETAPREWSEWRSPGGSSGMMTSPSPFRSPYGRPRSPAHEPRPTPMEEEEVERLAPAELELLGAQIAAAHAAIDAAMASRGVAPGVPLGAARRTSSAAMQSLFPRGATWNSSSGGPGRAGSNSMVAS